MLVERSTFHRQRGTTLVIALILLLVLTILGVATMNTTSLEERMSANSQEVNRALQAAETGLTAAFNAPAVTIATVGPAVTAVLNVGDRTAANPQHGAAAVFTRTFRQATQPPRDALLDPALYQTNHFDMQSTGASDVINPGGGALNATANAAIVQLRAGMFRVGPRSTR
jgi:hypothetical protein